MKKYLGILVAIMLCVCAIAPAASAADLSALTGALEGVNLDNLSADEIADVLGVDLGSVDTVLAEIENVGSGDGVSSILSTLSTGSDAAAAGSDFDLSALTDLLGSADLSGIVDSISSGDALSSLTGLFEGIDMSSFDISSLTDMISGAFGDSGVDLGSITEGLDLGSIDIGSILGGSTAGGSSDDITSTLSGIADALMSGLSSLGIDTSMLDGLGDTDIVNFFANLFVGLGQSEGADNNASSGSDAAKPAATTATPNTGDSSAVFVAFGTLCVASAAAFVCAKKNKVEE